MVQWLEAAKKVIFTAFIESILLGIAVAAIPGPVFFEIIRRTLVLGIRAGLALTVGAFLADLSVLILVFLGINSFMLPKPATQALFLLGGAVLLWLGIAAFKLRKNDIKLFSRKKYSGNSSVAAGFCMAITNPVAVISWASLGGAYLAQYASKAEAFANITLLAFGAMIFFSSMALAAHFTRRKISADYVLRLSKVFGSLLIIYGIYFLFRFINLALT